MDFDNGLRGTVKKGGVLVLRASKFKIAGHGTNDPLLSGLGSGSFGGFGSESDFCVSVGSGTYVRTIKKNASSPWMYYIMRRRNLGC